MNIVLVIPSLIVGGAEVFVIRLANQLAHRNHKVFLLLYDPTRRSALLEERIDKRVKIITFDHILSIGQTIWWKTLYMATQWNAFLHSKVLYRRSKVKARAFSGFLERLCVQEKIQVINTHLQAADWAVAHYFWKKQRPQNFVISMHGCYNRSSPLAASVIRHLDNDRRKVMEAADRIVLLTPKNALSVKAFSLKNDPVYIPLGFERITPLAPKNDTSADAPLTFGLVSRAVARKGWEQAIEATARLHNEGIHCQLILVGGGAYQEKLQNEYDHLPFVHFAGATAQVLDWVHRFDVGLFPSYIESESFPNTIIEYLACSKPVIGTDIGEVKNMLSTPQGRLAGKLLDFDPQGISVTQLAKHMRDYSKNRPLLTEHGKAAKLAFEKFDMELCALAYETAYQ
jgi:glycosyltransferase involved in cell wall biosynthesis